MASAKTKSLKGTGSGVVGHRILAVIIDWIILTIISFAIVGSSFIGSGFNFGALFGSIMIVVLINFLYGFILEGWRGQICHVAITDNYGRFLRYKIVDPSFQNWFGLALALRGQQISDFPLCNKSFNLSYCGHDL